MKKDKELIMDHSFENAAREKGYKLICGIDEAGRGPLAGPVCAAAVILPEGIEIEGLNDSKKLTEKKMEPIATIYWCVITAIYLGWSFYTMEWDRTWIIWPSAAVLYGAFYGIAHYMDKK